jgi:hypothetical protein
MPSQTLPTVVVGASQKPERYSYMAMQMLKEYGHPVVGVHPKLTEVEGVSVYPDISQAVAALESVHTITMYLGAARSSGLEDVLIAAQPKRVIFNPGAENLELQARLEEAGVEVVEGCTLVMLRTEQF